MKQLQKWLIDSLLFLTIIVIALIIFNSIFIMFVQVKNTDYRTNAMYKEYIEKKTNNEITYAFFGDSHTQYDINPFFINDSFNFASSGEDYIETYYKLKRVIDNDNVTIRNVILEIDPHIFSRCIRSENLFNEICLFSSYIPANEIISLKNISILKYSIARYFPVIGQGESMIMSKFYTPAKIYLGWMNMSGNFSNQNKVQNAIQTVRLYYCSDVQILEEKSFTFFLKTIDLAKSNNVTVILIKLPHSQEYNTEVNKQGVDLEKYYIQLLQKIESTEGTTKILDYYDVFFGRPELFSDSDHLNYAGAELFSSQLSEDLGAIGQ